MRIFIATLLLHIAAMNANAQFDAQRYPIIPRPQTLLALGDNFEFGGFVSIVTEGKGPRKECEMFRQQVKQLFGVELRYAKFAGFTPYIYVQLDSSFVPAEGYRLIVTKQGIDVYGTRAGIFYGLQTLLQLIQRAEGYETKYFIPACSIIDYPRFAWRGMHLDVARHFFPKENVKDYLRWMAYYKLNTFHWHLTDDQGWRIQIKRYPLLTDVGAWRNATLIGHYSEEPDRYDSTRYGGFYTQEEVKEIVAFADSLHITVVPEIEMPGHASAMIAAYPTLGNNQDKKYEVACTWGVFTEVLSPKPQTFTQLEGILNEVCELFPGKYIHIGGDECPKEEWKKSDYCQQLIKENKLNDEHGLQSWFVQRIVNYLASKGKSAIGWDEILEGGLADGAAVMSWRGEEGGIAAAKAGHNVVMTPGSHCYFDHYQSMNPGEPLAIGGFLPIEKVYSYDPVPAVLNESEKKYIMGVQANVWTEYLPVFSDVQYMIFPRIAALAEVAWTNTSVKDYPGFVQRVQSHLKLYSRMNCNHSRALYEIKPHYESSADGVQLLLSRDISAGEIRYAHHRNQLTSSGKIYNDPIVISGNDSIFAAVYWEGDCVSPVYSQAFTGHSALGKTVTLRKQPAPAYNNGGATTLVDGITGRSPWTGSEWLGWWGDTLDALIDLGALDTIHSIRIYSLNDPGSWIYFPANFSIEFSLDGETFLPSKAGLTYPYSANGMRQAEFNTTAYARYVRIKASPLQSIPVGSPGAGYPAWLFVSEIIVE